MTPMRLPSRRTVGFLALAALVFGLLRFGYIYLDDLTRGETGTMFRRLVEELSGATAVWIAVPAAVFVARRWPVGAETWRRHLPVQLGALVVVSFVLTAWRWGFRSLVFPLVGLGSFDYGPIGLRALMELPNDMIFGGAALAIVQFLDRQRAAREQLLRATRLEAELAEARLSHLEAQLQPHFLFNTLNAISEVVHEDAGKAERMVTGLAELLRASMPPGEPLIPLAEELHLVEVYLDVMRGRFEARLDAGVEAGAGVRDALVPRLVLQPLVENALRHGLDGSGRARLRVSAGREGGRLVLRVRDHGSGLGEGAGAEARGLGLRNTVARLAELYGGAARLELRDEADGGCTAEVTLPLPGAA